jgi:hypothetical protein
VGALRSLAYFHQFSIPGSERTIHSVKGDPEVLETALCTSKNTPHQPLHAHRMNKEFLAPLNEVLRRKQINPPPTKKLPPRTTSPQRAKAESVWSPGSPKDQQPKFLHLLARVSLSQSLFFQSFLKLFD